MQVKNPEGKDTTHQHKSLFCKGVCVLVIWVGNLKNEISNSLKVECRFYVFCGWFGWFVEGG